MQYVAIGIRCLIGTVFLVSSFSKVKGRDAFDAFVVSVRDMETLPSRLVRPVAFIVVCAEFSVCVTLATPGPWIVITGFAIAVGLLAAFAVGIALAVRGGVRAHCRCFGASVTPLGLRHVVRNVVLLSVAAIGAVTTLSDGAVDGGGAVVALFAGLVLGGMVTVLDDVVELFRPHHRYAVSSRSSRSTVNH
ncbi:MauE/DoxX family redox-associated membrane protein [Sphaerisporangium sp. NPDC004334]